MPLEVPCPSCQSVLRAPDDAAGKRVKCKKCEHRFYLPGGPPRTDSVGDSQSLSVVDVPASPFAFENPGGAVVVPKGRPPRPEPAREPQSRHEAKSSGSGKVLLIVGGVIGFVCLAGMGAVAAVGYYFYVKTADAVRTVNSATTAVAERPATKPPPIEVEESRPAATEPTGRGRAEKAPATGEKSPDASVSAPKKSDSLPPVTFKQVPAFKLPPTPKEKLELVAKAKEKLALELPVETVRAVRFAHGNPPVVAVLWTSQAPFQGAGGQDAVDLYGRATGKRTDRIEFPSDGFAPDRPRLFELSQDGNRIAIEHPPGRLTVYDFESKTKMVEGKDPFDGSASLTGPPGAFRFVDDDSVAVFDRFGGLVVWNVASQQRIAEAASPGAADKKHTNMAATTVQEGRIQVATRGQVMAVGLKDGKPLGLPQRLPNASDQPLAVALDSLGKRVAILAAPSPVVGPRVIVADRIKNGLTVIPVPATLPQQTGGLAGVGFTGSDAILVIAIDGGSGAILYDLESATPVGYLRSPTGPAVQVIDEAGGRHSWVMPDPKNPKLSLLISIELPFDEYFKLVTEAKARKGPVYLELRPEGLAN